MNKLWLRITGIVVGVLVVVIAVNVFRHDETAPIAESRNLKSQPRTQQSKVKQVFELAEPKWSNTAANRIYIFFSKC